LDRQPQGNFIKKKMKKILLLGSGELGKEFVISAKRLGVKFQEVVHAKESWDTWVNEDPKKPTTSNA
jgi:formate-dependent phosphoribosylglycinamide formyltransferase (GAR transformylase)